jgi:hypothetical protein
VPPDLVGDWDGDLADYSFSSDGYVVITGIGHGTVEVADSEIAFYLPGVTPWTDSWQVGPCGDPAGYGYPFRTLSLGQYSYLQDC